MTEKQAETKTRRPTKAERLHALAQARYAPHKATRWPYLLRGDGNSSSRGQNAASSSRTCGRRGARRYPEKHSRPRRTLTRRSMTCATWPSRPTRTRSTAEDLAADILAAHGISAIPDDRGLNLVTGWKTARCRTDTSSPSRTSSRRTAFTS